MGWPIAIGSVTVPMWGELDRPRRHGRLELLRAESRQAKRLLSHFMSYKDGLMLTAIQVHNLGAYRTGFTGRFTRNGRQPSPLPSSHSGIFTVN
jgi:hypothetical protein